LDAAVSGKTVSCFMCGKTFDAAAPASVADETEARSPVGNGDTAARAVRPSEEKEHPGPVDRADVTVPRQGDAPGLGVPYLDGSPSQGPGCAPLVVLEIAGLLAWLVASLVSGC
jgi:hypothetical protein